MNRLRDSTMSRVWRRSYLAGNAFELWISFAGVLAGVTYLVAPGSLADSSVGQQAGALASAWSLLYVAGSLAIVRGLWSSRPRWEVGGLSLLGAATAINAIAVVAFRGLSGVATALTYVSLSVAALIRGYYVIRVSELNEE